MIPDRMLYVRIAVPRESVQPVLSLLHETGVMEIERSVGEPPELHERLVETRKRMAVLVNASRPRPQGRKEAMRSILLPDPIVPRPTAFTAPDKVLEQGVRVADDLDWAIAAHSRLKELRARRSDLEDELDAIKPVLGAPVRLSEVGERRGYVLAFIRPGDTPPEETVWTSSDNEVSLIALRDPRSLVSFDRLEFPSAPALPADRAMELAKDIEAVTEEIERTRDELSALGPEHGRFLALREQLANAARQVEAVGTLSGGRYTYEITGWITKRDRGRLDRSVKRSSKGLAHVEYSERDDAPTSIRNPGWARPFEGIVSLYGTPSRNEVDPTVLTAMTFILIFGIMLGDLGYGLIILGLSIYGHRIIGRSSPAVKGASVLGLELGASTAIVGFISGSFFGDLHSSVFGRDELYHLEIGGVVLPIDLIDNVTGLIVLSILIGVVMLYVSVIIGGVNDLRNGKRKDFVLKRVSWIVLLPASILLIMMFLFEASYPPAVETAALVMTLAMIGLILIDVAFFLLFEVTGMLGDALSFIRIMALGLATTLLAMALNSFALTMGGMLPVGLSAVVIALLLIGGHIGNLALQALGAGVHSLRLQFVEFYKRFYEGEGRPFEPFHAQRLYTKIEIEEGNR